MKGASQEAHGGERRGEIDFSMTERMFDIIAVDFEDIEVFGLDFPPCPGASDHLGNRLSGHGQHRSWPTMSQRRFHCQVESNRFD